MKNNFNLAATTITAKIRVSTAAIYYESQDRFQVETWIFSQGEELKSRMFIHGDVHGEITPEDKICDFARTFHRRISRKLVREFGDEFLKEAYGLSTPKTSIS